MLGPLTLESTLTDLLDELLIDLHGLTLPDLALHARSVAASSLRHRLDNIAQTTNNQIYESGANLVRLEASDYLHLQIASRLLDSPSERLLGPDLDTLINWAAIAVVGRDTLPSPAPLTRPLRTAIHNAVRANAPQPRTATIWSKQ
jgi:hypothetical protein